MIDVFISYARDNQAVVRRLAEAVKAEGYSVWWDDELPPHRAYGDVITEQIGAAKAAIVVWSASAAASEWVRAEADVARGQKKLIQVSIDERMPPLPFNQLHFVSIGDWRGEADHPGWRKVKESLAALCGAEGAERPLHPMPPVPPPSAPRRGSGLTAALVAIALLVLAGFILLAWTRGAPPPAAPPPAAPAEPPKPASQELPPPPPKALPRPQPRPGPAAERRSAEPVDPRRARRYCMGPGRGTGECRRLRARYSR